MVNDLEERLVEVEGGFVQVFLAGIGDVVTCLASPTGTALPHPLADFALSAGRIVAINPRGAGRSSPRGSMVGPIRQLVADAEAVRQRLGIECWVVIGQSQGGWFALEYALTFPHAVGGLILTDTSSSWRFYLDMDSIYNNRRDDFREIQEIRTRALTTDATVEELKSWMRITHHRGEIIDDLAPRSIEARRAAAGVAVEVPTLLAAMMDEVLGKPPFSGRWDVTDRLHQIAAPTLIIHGRYDNIIPPRWGDLLHERIADSELVSTESGHFAFAEEPDEVRAVIQRFISENVRSRGSRSAGT